MTITKKTMNDGCLPMGFRRRYPMENDTAKSLGRKYSLPYGSDGIGDLAEAARVLGCGVLCVCVCVCVCVDLATGATGLHSITQRRNVDAEERSRSA